MGFVDTNIFVEVFARGGLKAIRSADFLDGQEIKWISSMVLLEFEWVMRSVYVSDKKYVVESIRTILGNKSIRLVGKNKYMDAVNMYEEYNMDFTDCCIVVEMLHKKRKMIYSYDKHFGKLGFVERKEP